MKKLILLALLGMTGSAIANIYILTGKDLSNYGKKVVEIKTKKQESFYQQYDYSCDVGESAYYVYVEIDNKQIVLKVGCSKESVFGSFVKNYLFAVIDSPNNFQCKLEENCHYDYNGNKQCTNIYGNQIRTEYLYVGTDFDGYASTLDIRYKETICK